MKKIMHVLFFITCFLLLVSCSGNNAVNVNHPPEEIFISYNSASSTNEFTSVQEPSGIIFFRDNILVTSRSDNSILIFDSNGKHIKTIGSTGNGPLEFINPSGMATHDGNLYIVDSGNSRIQILNNNFEYIDSLTLEPLSKVNSSDYTDIAVDSMGTAYLTTNNLFKEKAKVYIVKDDSITTTSKNLYGYVFADENNIWAVNTLVLYETDNKFGASTGISNIYKIQNNKLEEKFEFPYKYGPTDFIIKDGYIYVLSCVWARLDKWSLDGDYQETLCKFDKLSPQSFLSTYLDGFLVADKMNNTVYKVSIGD